MKHLILTTLLLASSSWAQTFTDLQGKPLTFDPASPQQPSVLIFWASWCGYCMKEIPHLKALQSEYPALRWLGVNVNKEPADGLLTEQQRQLTWPSITDPELQLADQFGIRATPGLIVLDANGQRLYSGRRSDDAFRAALARAAQSASPAQP